MSKLSTVWFCPFESSMCILLASCSSPFRAKLCGNDSTQLQEHTAPTFTESLLPILLLFSSSKKNLNSFQLLEATHMKSQIINLIWLFYPGMGCSVNERTSSWHFHKMDDAQTKAIQELNSETNFPKKTRLLGLRASGISVPPMPHCSYLHESFLFLTGTW